MLYDACSFTQTYGDHRENLFQLRRENRLDHYTRNLLKNNIFSFHNSSNEFVEHIDRTYLKPYYENYVIMIQNEIPYGRCIENALDFIKNSNVENILYIEDDSYCIAENETLVEDTFSLIFENSMQMVCLDNRSNEETNPNKETVDCCDFDKVYSKGESKIWYNTPNRVLEKRGQAMMDNSPFFSNVDYLRTNYWDQIYTSLPSVHKGEEYTYTIKKYEDDVVRFHVEKSLYRNINVIWGSGGNHHYRPEYIVKQICLFLGR